jgi:hypothetical protein
MRLALTIFSWCMLSGIAHAETDVNKFLQDYDRGTAAEKRLMADSLARVESGMSWVNVYLAEDRKERPVYCPPNTLAPSNEELVGILRKEAEASPSEGSRPLGLVLMLALQKAFPCSK